MTTKFASVTSVGNVRQHNEDYVACFPEHGLWLLADGMGGHQGGEIASRVACDSIVDAVREGASLDSAIQGAHNQIKMAVQQGQGKSGMGTTLVAAYRTAGKYQISWVGDSRGYLWHAGKLCQITEDHSFVQHLVNQGIITPAEAQSHPKRNVITQSLGAAKLDQVKIGTRMVDLAPGDKLLLCSDGLSNEVSAKQMQDLFGQINDTQLLAETLLDAAIDAGGRDNISAIVIGQ